MTRVKTVIAQTDRSLNAVQPSPGPDLGPKAHDETRIAKTRLWPSRARRPLGLPSNLASQPQFLFEYRFQYLPIGRIG